MLNKESNKIPVSQCCYAPPQVKNGEEGTSYYICSNCGKEFISQIEDTKEEVLNQELKSQCCNADAKVVGSGEDTYYMVCSKCDKEFITKVDSINVSKQESKQEISLEEKLSLIIENQFVLLKKGKPAWDVLVIKDILEFKEAIEDLINEIRAKDKEEFNKDLELAHDLGAAEKQFAYTDEALDDIHNQWEELKSKYNL